MMRMKMLLWFILFATVAGCAGAVVEEREGTGGRNGPDALSASAQELLDALNGQCEEDPWRSEVDMLERPETRPAGYAVSGEVRAYIEDFSKRLL